MNMKRLVLLLMAMSLFGRMHAQRPEIFAPQYGGYCAHGTSQGHKAPTEAGTWTIFNGKLYFNYNQPVKQTLSKDMEHLIEAADQKWPILKQSK
jgi:hypothetical protein